MDYLPLFVNLKNKPVLVVGGGKIAARKINFLCRVGARILLITDHIGHHIQALIKTYDNIKWIDSNFSPEQLDNIFLVIVATNDKQLNAQIFEAANLRHKLINIVDDKSKCTFIFPSIVERSPLVIAISSNGNAPVLSKLIREKIESILPKNIGKIAKIAGQWRNKVKNHYSKLSDRRRFWEKAFNGLFASQIASGNIIKACNTLNRELNNPIKHFRGEIILVGAGPGDSSLLTIRGLQVIQAADVVLYDNLVSDEILELVRRDAELIYVGKRAGLDSINQAKINELLVILAQQGKCVVRLKGGDPFIFGRGGEELQAAKLAGIDFQVVPGITSAIGAAAYAGIPLTYRNYSQSVLFITGQCSKNNHIDWSSLAQTCQTLVIYMGAIKAKEISSKLIKYGRDYTTPVAVIGRGTYQDQKIITGTLDQLEKLSIMVPMPSLMIIGEVVKLRNELAWL